MKLFFILVILLIIYVCNYVTNAKSTSILNQLNVQNNKGLINYFAYGSNLNYDVLSKRTGGGSINDGQPPQPGILKNYALIFNVGKPPFPAFASVEKVVKENEINEKAEIKEKQIDLHKENSFKNSINEA